MKPGRDLRIENTAGIHVWLVLWKAYDALRAHAESSLQDMGFCLSDFGILEVLLHKGPQPVIRLSRRLRLTGGSMSVAVDRLENRGLVKRKSDPGDRRGRVVHLTPAGRSLIATAFAQHAEVMEHAAAGLPADKRARLLKLLKAVGKAAAANSTGGLTANRIRGF